MLVRLLFAPLSSLLLDSTLHAALVRTINLQALEAAAGEGDPERSGSFSAGRLRLLAWSQSTGEAEMGCVVVTQGWLVDKALADRRRVTKVIAGGFWMRTMANVAPS